MRARRSGWQIQIESERPKPRLYRIHQIGDADYTAGECGVTLRVSVLEDRV
jgi:hypothetical protein